MLKMMTHRRLISTRFGCSCFVCLVCLSDSKLDDSEKIGADGLGNEGSVRMDFQGLAGSESKTRFARDSKAGRGVASFTLPARLIVERERETEAFQISWFHLQEARLRAAVLGQVVPGGAVCIVRCDPTRQNNKPAAALLPKHQ